MVGVVTSIKVPVVQFKEFREKYAEALKNDLMDQPKQGAQTLLSNGMPKIDIEDLAPFIDWAFLRLYPELPDKYFLQTADALWLISGDDCIVWSIN
tara:strand:- start:2992 stop:3279 length:288 start_codon:yes stop_codon:yes gene_type:complete